MHAVENRTTFFFHFPCIGETNFAERWCGECTACDGDQNAPGVQTANSISRIKHRRVIVPTHGSVCVDFKFRLIKRDKQWNVGDVITI